MAPPSPISCRPSAARHALLLRVPAPRTGGATAARGLPSSREALRVHARPIEAAARPWMMMHRSWREQPARCAAAGQVVGSTGVGRSAGVEVTLAAAAVVAMATGNRVLYKLALVPLREYPFFLAQLATFGYPLFSPRLSIPHTPPRCFELRLLLAAACDRIDSADSLLGLSILNSNPAVN
jgi:hypothetical protein